MEYCNNCGVKLDPEHNCCIECGADVMGTNSVKEIGENKTEEHTKQPLPDKHISEDECSFKWLKNKKHLSWTLPLNLSLLLTSIYGVVLLISNGRKKGGTGYIFPVALSIFFIFSFLVYPLLCYLFACFSREPKKKSAGIEQINNGVFLGSILIFLGIITAILSGVSKEYVNNLSPGVIGAWVFSILGFFCGVRIFLGKK